MRNQLIIKNNWYKPNLSIFDKDYFSLTKKFFPPQRTKKEINFIIKSLKLKPPMKILDLCCGWGRHSIELAKRGYNVVGQDLNPLFLKEAKNEAKKEKVKIKWIKSDMRLIPFRNEFETVINISTSFGYFSKDEDNEKVLKEIAKALKPGGFLFLDIYNREYFIHYFGDKQKTRQKISNKLTMITKRFFDFESGFIFENRLLFSGHRKIKEMKLKLRQFTLKELILIAQKNGLVFQKCFGDFNGHHFSAVTPRCIFIAKKA